ncbi:uncharacterized protein BDW47DRAFT_128817 [Aspergillus candidus]|uniref:Sds3-like-domain-containing protein n=1 Tax=Aspergillus candidus TaxID=41067 RepID=A0A2I2F245_ASPCN|nr:hypothetical protein BDW47DRAFT_128817 [Aspergillus candidus]PLB34687.1 hypothetical protein BDW47DRAFT_128817 [Aspergillus candidus]
MAGVKRKMDATRAPATGQSSGNAANDSTPNNTPNSTGDTSHFRVTRSHRASQDARVHPTDATNSSSKHSGPQRPSRIVTLSTRAVRGYNPANNSANNPANAAANHARETRSSRTRSSISSASAKAPQSEDLASAAVPETPRAKRVKRGPAVEDTPRSTRQSARLKSHSHPSSNEFPTTEPLAASKPADLSPSATFTPSGRTRNRSRLSVNGANDLTVAAPLPPAFPAPRSPSPRSALPERIEFTQPFEEKKAPRGLGAKTHPPDDEPKSALSPEETKPRTSRHATPESERPQPSEAALSPSARPAKRKSGEMEPRDEPNGASGSFGPSKKAKLEDGEKDSAMEETFRASDEGKPASPSAAGADEFTGDNDSRQVTEDVEEPMTENAAESTTAKSGRGGRNRGRGRGSGAARGRAGIAKRGRGGTRSGRGGRGRQLDRSSDAELARTPSPTPATQRLRDRQRELDRTFRKVAAAQRLALAVLASQSQKKLARDKNAHKDVPEFDKINLLLKARLAEKKEILRREYQLRVDQENRLFTANKAILEERSRYAAQHIKDEHLLACQGDYMALVEGRRAAEDDEHTETEGSGTEPERVPVIPPSKGVVRGFLSSYVRDPAGAAAYERAEYGWDDFLQRAKLGDDIDPQMKEMTDTGPFAGRSAGDVIDLLVQATNAVEVRRGPFVERDIRPPPVPEAFPAALSALADVASAEMPRSSLSHLTTPQPGAHRTLLPQQPPPPPHVAHGPTEPRPFVLPPPTPQRQRRLLPAAQQIPSINEQLGLPGLFSPRGGPPQLPPPPGSNFHRPPLPGFMAGHPPPPNMYYPPHPSHPPHPPPPGPPRPPY